MGILLGISVLAGIIFVHKYKFDSSDSSYDNRKDVKDLSNATIGTDSSQNIEHTDNIKK